jgi:hypothetical protein
MHQRGAALVSTVLVAACAVAGIPSVTESTAAAAVEPPRIAAAGDIACAPPANPGARTCRDDDTANKLVAGGYTKVLTLGDNQYECGQLAAYRQVYDASWGKVKDKTAPIPGEDDYSGGGCATPGAAGYFTYFGDAATPLQLGCRQSCRGWYSYDVGDWHVLALNTACNEPGVGGCSASSPQVTWLKQDLADNNQTQCTLAYMHRPYWANGNVVAKYKPIVNALYAAGVDVLLTGNSHLYARYARQNPNSGVDNTRGIREFIVGTGGKSHSKLSTSPLPNLQAGNDTTYGVLELTLRPTSYDWNFVAAQGPAYSDAGSTVCS